MTDNNKAQIFSAPTALDLYEEVELSTSQEREALSESIVQLLKDNTLGKIPILNKILSFADSVQENLDKQRLLCLLAKYKERMENVESAINKFVRLLSHPAGLLLFQKIKRIANASLVDEDFANVLATVLKRVCDSDFVGLFAEHNYVLSQIEKLSPQALLLLSDNKFWPQISFSSTSVSGVTSGQGWDTDFAQKYVRLKGLSDVRAESRAGHVLHELKNNNLIELQPSALSLTMIGCEVCQYLI